jgi:hypothetical protein
MSQLQPTIQTSTSTDKYRQRGILSLVPELSGGKPAMIQDKMLDGCGSQRRDVRWIILGALVVSGNDWLKVQQHQQSLQSASGGGGCSNMGAVLEVVKGALSYTEGVVPLIRDEV